MAIESSSESWKKMVLRSMPPPAWLEPDAPDGDVVVSTRHRFARNLCSFRFPHHASNEELRQIQQQVQSAAKVSPVPLEPMGRLTEAERDYLLGSRLISADFSHREVGRSVLLDRSRMVSVMVNVPVPVPRTSWRRPTRSVSVTFVVMVNDSRSAELLFPTPAS